MPRSYKTRYPRKGKKSLSSQCKKNTKKINQLESDIEVKAFDTIWNVATVYDTGTNLQNLSLITQNLLPNGRVGNKISVKSIEVRGKITLDATKPNQLVRMMIVAQSDYTAPNITSILQTASCFGHRTVKYKNNNVMLFDKVFSMNDGLDNAPDFNFKIKRKFNMDFAGPLGTDYSAKQIYGFVISDQSVSNWPALVSNVRVNYVDA